MAQQQLWPLPFSLVAERMERGFMPRTDWGSILVYLRNGVIVRPMRSDLDSELAGTKLSSADIELLQSLELPSGTPERNASAFQNLMRALSHPDVVEPGLDPAWVNELMCFVRLYGSRQATLVQRVNWLTEDGAAPMLALLLVTQRGDFWRRLAQHYHLELLEFNPVQMGADPLKVPDWQRNPQAVFEARRAMLNAPQAYAINQKLWRLSRELIGMCDVLICAASVAHDPLKQFLRAYSAWEKKQYPSTKRGA